MIEAAADAQDYGTTSWPALLLPGWNTQVVLDGLHLDHIDDGDPEATEAMRKVRALLDDAPPTRDLDNRRLRWWGYVVPLKFEQRNVREFLLAPYFGACLHAPASPAQVVHVTPATPVTPEVRGTSAVWVAGTLRRCAPIPTWAPRASA